MPYINLRSRSIRRPAPYSTDKAARNKASPRPEPIAITDDDLKFEPYEEFLDNVGRDIAHLSESKAKFLGSDGNVYSAETNMYSDHGHEYRPSNLMFRDNDVVIKYALFEDVRNAEVNIIKKLYPDRFICELAPIFLPNVRCEAYGFAMRYIPNATPVSVLYQTGRITEEMADDIVEKYAVEVMRACILNIVSEKDLGASVRDMLYNEATGELHLVDFEDYVEDKSLALQKLLNIPYDELRAILA